MRQMHFVLPAHSARFLTELDDLGPDARFPFWLGGDVIWSLLSYLVLREHRDGMTISCEPEPGMANFAHVSTWRRIGRRHGEFRISARADYRRLFDVDMEVLQNPVQAEREGKPYLPHWPMPGLISRAQGRNGVRRIAYAGRPGRGTMEDEVARAIERSAQGLDFVMLPPKAWNDMRDVDLLVAIRTLDRQTHDTKPPSKLFNAWLAEIPLVAGHDSAFSAVGTAGQDYVRIGSGEELREAITRLSEDRDHYERVVEHGRARRSSVSFERIAATWLEVIDGPVEARCQTWLSRGGPALDARLGRVLDNLRRFASRSRGGIIEGDRNGESRQDAPRP